jgi:hypothetical protein
MRASFVCLSDPKPKKRARTFSQDLENDAQLDYLLNFDEETFQLFDNMDEIATVAEPAIQATDPTLAIETSVEPVITRTTEELVIATTTSEPAITSNTENLLASPSFETTTTTGATSDSSVGEDVSGISDVNAGSCSAGKKGNFDSIWCLDIKFCRPTHSREFYQLIYIIEVIRTMTFGIFPILELHWETGQLLREPFTFRGIDGFTMMHLAAYYGHDEGILWLALRGCPVNIFMSSGVSPLHLASFRNHTRAVQALLNCRADILAFSALGRTALMAAVRSDACLPTLEVFLERISSDLRMLSLVLNGTDGRGKSLLELAHLGTAKLSNSETPGLPSLYSGASDLIIARLLAFAPHLRVDLDFLCRLYGSDRVRFYRLAAHFPVESIRALKLILSVDLVVSAIEDDQLQILRAIATRNVSVLLDFDGSNCLLPVHVAAIRGRVEILRYFHFELGISVLTTKCRGGLGVLQHAQQHGQGAVVEFVEDCQALEFAKSV